MTTLLDMTFFERVDCLLSERKKRVEDKEAEERKKAEEKEALAQRNFMALGCVFGESNGSKSDLDFRHAIKTTKQCCIDIDF